MGLVIPATQTAEAGGLVEYKNVKLALGTIVRFHLKDEGEVERREREHGEGGDGEEREVGNNMEE